MSLIFSCHVLLNSRRALCYKQRANVDRLGGCSAMLWARIHHGDQPALVGEAGALAGINYQYEILKRYVIPHMNVNG